MEWDLKNGSSCCERATVRMGKMELEELILDSRNGRILLCAKIGPNRSIKKESNSEELLSIDRLCKGMLDKNVESLDNHSMKVSYSCQGLNQS